MCSSKEVLQTVHNTPVFLEPNIICYIFGLSWSVLTCAHSTGRRAWFLNSGAEIYRCTF